MTGSVRNNFCQRKSLQLLTTRDPNRRSSKTLDQRPRPLEPHPNSGAGIPPPRRALNPRIERQAPGIYPSEMRERRCAPVALPELAIVLGLGLREGGGGGGGHGFRRRRGLLSACGVGSAALPRFCFASLRLRLRLLLPERGIKRSQAKWRRSKEKGIVGFGGQ